MPNIPSVGIFAPNGYLNVGSFSSPSGQGDAYGNLYPTGTTPGKAVMLSAPEARMLQAPGTNLYDGVYQVVQLDSGATQANASLGLAAYIRLDSGPTDGALPMTDYEIPTVTTGDIANQISAGNLSLFAGVFINPATLNGQSNTPIPGQYCFLFVGAGRATVQYASGQSGAIGNQVIPAGTGAPTQFNSNASGSFVATPVPSGIGANATSAGGAGVAYFSELIYRIGGQGV